ncbi:MAG: SMI1/KNR4 family protein, partial [Gemmatimonadetes bacterium]|nr:SMI1/KNR4 family protein [Gemmatimonadota bacterium]
MTDEDGREERLELLPPATDAEIAAIEASFSISLPAELREALRVSAGFANGPIESLGFLDVDGFGMEDVFPHAYPVGHDGFGNYWILDLLPDKDDCGPVFFACHDPPVIAFQSADLSDFVQEVVALWKPGHHSSVDIVHEEVTSSIWTSNTGIMNRETALSSADAVIAEFASSFPDEAMFADLRLPKIGDGFSWGRYGPRTEWRRAGARRLWVTVPPQR